MTPLDYDIFFKVRRITGGLTLDRYDFVLMVDADTVIKYNSIQLMIKAMNHDPSLLGLCGETKIANKTASWVSMIQASLFLQKKILNFFNM